MMPASFITIIDESERHPYTEIYYSSVSNCIDLHVIVLISQNAKRMNKKRKNLTADHYIYFPGNRDGVMFETEIATVNRTFESLVEL